MEKELSSYDVLCTSGERSDRCAQDETRADGGRAKEESANAILIKIPQARHMAPIPVS
jgi:hypothetical protein